jgi:hypothetical protein
MRDHTGALYKDLLARGNETVSITPSAATQLATFEISGLPPHTSGLKNYAHDFHVGVTVTFDPDAAGDAVNSDKLWKVGSSFRLYNDWHGDLYPHQQTRGAVLAHIIDVVANGYEYDIPSRIQIPTNTDTDVTLEMSFSLPLAFEVCKKPHEFAQWLGYFNGGGVVEAMIAAETVYGSDYAGAVIKAPCTVRSQVEYQPSEDDSLGVPFQWRERQIVGGGNQPLLKSVGQETNLLGIEQGCGLAWLCWLSDATGIGLDGPDGVDNFTSLEIPWRGQTQIRNLDNLFKSLRRAAQHRVAPISGIGTTIMHDGGGWPSTMAATPNGRLAADSQKLFLPLLFPGLDFETSKAMRAAGDLPINFGVTTPITGTHRFVSWELLEYNNDQIERLKVAMGAAGKKAVRRGINGNSVADVGNLRYTRWFFE